MSLQKLVFATLAGFVGLFGLGLLIYVVLFPEMSTTVDAAAQDMMREYFPGIIIFEILYGLLLAIIFGRWAGISTFNTGLKAGAVIGLILGLCQGLWMYSTTTLFTVDAVWWSAVTFLVRFAVAGGLVGWVLGRE